MCIVVSGRRLDLEFIMACAWHMLGTRHARLFKNGRNQAVRIPREMELPGREVLIHREGTKLIIEPVELPLNLLDVLSNLAPTDDSFPNVDDGLMRPHDIRI